MQKIDVSIIMVNYKTSKLVCDAIRSVQCKSKGFSFECIIVDNSEDQNELLQLQNLESDNVYLIDSNANLGFGKANNLGVTFAKGEYLFFLNSDTLLINNAIYELKDFLDNNPNAGIAGSNLYTQSGEANLSFSLNEKNVKNDKKEISLYSALKHRMTKKRPGFNYTNVPMRINGCVIGAAMMIRKELFDKLGGFDNDIFMYAEESLLSFRAIHEQKMEIYNVPSSKIIHFEGGSYSKATLRRISNHIDGNYVYFCKAFSKKEAIRYLKSMKRIYARKKMLSHFIEKRKKQEFTDWYNGYKAKLLYIKNNVDYL